MRITRRGLSFINNAVNEVKKRRPIADTHPDTKRIDRELTYMQRIRRVNPKLKALQSRRMKAQQRRSLHGR